MKWNRSLGTSKREQGIATPKAPHNRKRGYVMPVVETTKKRWWQKLWHRKEKK